MEQLNKFIIPVKVTRSDYANAILDGQIYMNSMHYFGSWSAIENSGKHKQTGDDERNDIFEGLVRNIDTKELERDNYFKLYSPEIRAAMEGAWLIDDSRQFTKIFCMYSLTYDLTTSEFEKPDDRLINLGDTAVIIHNPAKFFSRLKKKSDDEYKQDYIPYLGKVNYYDLHIDFGNFDPIFNKSSGYSWQKELRFAIDLLDGNYSLMLENGQFRQPQIQNIDPIIMEIGDLRDIAITIPTEDLVKLELPPEVFLDKL